MNEVIIKAMKPEDTFTFSDLKDLLKKSDGEMAVLANEAYLLGYKRALQAARQ